MQVLTIVPLDEVGVPGSCMFQGSGNPWIANRVLQGLVPRLFERIVIASPWAGITPDHHERIKEWGSVTPRIGLPLSAWTML